MSKMHIWVGNFESEELFEKYLDQKKYLEAWATYDNEPPTGEEEDSEPDPALRCGFCKEIDLDTYDEDFMAMKYYDNVVDVDRIAADILTDEEELESLWNKYQLDSVNALIIYEDKNLSIENASKSSSVQYLGKVNKITENIEVDSSVVHYLWIGEKETLSGKVVDFNDSEENITESIIKEIKINEDEVINVHFYYNDEKEKLDEMIITQVEDFNIAENMILKVDEMKVSSTANAILDLVVNENSKIDGLEIGSALGMKYIGKFESE